MRNPVRKKFGSNAGNSMKRFWETPEANRSRAARFGIGSDMVAERKTDLKIPCVSLS